ncbi:MAG: FAD-binding oxidoreductase [Pedosphaera sp.]|nr:FAD-binding oxidoreductase [Pedosphaera sp.]
MIHVPEDMTVTVAADVRLADVQTGLAQARQWLPIDPPDASATMAEILNVNASGPHRFGYGTVRDYVIGLKVRLADGRIVKSGGQVVKNVAGYDLQKLFIGSGGTLAVPVEVTFKLRPLPERESFVQQRFDTLDAAGAAIETVIESELTPVVFDLHRAVERGLQPASTSTGQSAPKRPEGRAPFAIVLGFDGTKEDVDWQLSLASQLGFREAASLDYDKSFHADAKPAQRLSVLPSKLIEALRALGDAPFVARAGNGIIFHSAGTADVTPPLSPVIRHLLRRVKDAFDPKQLLPELPA